MTLIDYRFLAIHLVSFVTCCIHEFWNYRIVHHQILNVLQLANHKQFQLTRMSWRLTLHHLSNIQHASIHTCMCNVVCLIPVAIYVFSYLWCMQERIRTGGLSNFNRSPLCGQKSVTCLATMAYIYSAYSVCVTIFSTGSKFWLVSFIVSIVSTCVPFTAVMTAVRGCCIFL